MRASVSLSRRCFVAWVVVVALSSFGCSGESSSEGDDTGGSSSGGTSGSSGSAASSSGGSSGSGGTPAYCETEFGPTDPTALVDDMEDNDSLVAGVSGRNGSWWVSADDPSVGTISPPADAAPPPERILGTRCGSEFGMRITGQGFATWGANLSISLKYEGMLQPIDASDFRGIMFWARVGETHNSPVRVQFQDASTFPEGGVCNPDPASGTEQCYDGWGTAVIPISTEWRLYKIDFSRTAQQGFGYGGEALDPSKLFTIEWAVLQNTVFDLWIDDVWFYE